MSAPVVIDWHKLPCVIFTGADTNALHEAALKMVADANLKHWIVSDCHDEQHIDKISAEVRKDPFCNKVLIFEGNTKRFARAHTNRSLSLMEFLTPRTSKLNCGLIILAPDVRPYKLYIELRVIADYIVHRDPKHQTVTVQTMDSWRAELTDTCQ